LSSPNANRGGKILGSVFTQYIVAPALNAASICAGAFSVESTSA
jgi:hypothetical protein